MSMCGEIENVEHEIAQLQERLRLLKGENQEPYWEFVSRRYKETSNDFKKVIEEA